MANKKDKDSKVEFLKVVYFDEDAAQDYIDITNGGRLDWTTEENKEKIAKIIAEIDAKAQGGFNLFNVIKAALSGEIKADAQGSLSNIVGSTLKNTLLTDYISAASGDSDVKKFGVGGVYAPANSIALYRMYSSYLNIVPKDQLPIDMEKLNDAILDLREYLNKDMLTSKIESYKNVLKPYLYLMPDAEYEPLTSEQYDQIAASLPDEIEKNYQLYLESLETPMPFYIGVPSIDGDKLKFNWDVSYDLDAEDITYSVEVARDYLFQDVIYQNTTLTVPESEMELPNAGQYFVRVRATNTSGKTQDAFDYYVTDEGKHYGMKCFYITEDNTVEEDIYEEG